MCLRRHWHKPGTPPTGVGGSSHPPCASTSPSCASLRSGTELGGQSRSRLRRSLTRQIRTHHTETRTLGELGKSACDLFLVNENFDSSILAPTAPRAVLIDWLARTVGNYANLGRVEALLADQISGDASSPPLAELVVVVLMADPVGLSGH